MGSRSVSDTPTVEELVHRTQRHLAGMAAAPLNRVASDISLDASVFSMQYSLETIVPQSMIAIDDEIVYVWEVNGDKDLTVQRAMLGTEAAIHVAGDVVEAPTRFLRPAIKDAMQEEVRSWPDGVFQVGTTVVAQTMHESIVDLGFAEDEFLFVLDVLQGPRGTQFSAQDRWRHVEFDVFRNFNGTASGSAVQINETYNEQDRDLLITVALPFVCDTVNDTDNVVTEWGVPRSVIDIISMGAASRLLMMHEAVRTETDAMQESRQHDQVPPQFITATAAAMRKWCNQRLVAEATRLRSRYPVRRG